MDKQSMGELMQWVNNGLAVVMLIAIAWFGLKGAVWFGKEFVIPIRDAVIAHLHNMDDCMKQLAKSVSDMKIDIADIKTQACRSSHEST